MISLTLAMTMTMTMTTIFHSLILELNLQGVCGADEGDGDVAKLLGGEIADIGDFARVGVVECELDSLSGSARFPGIQENTVS